MRPRSQALRADPAYRGAETARMAKREHLKYHAILEESRRKAAEKWRRRAGEGHLDLILGPRSEIVRPGKFPEQLLVVPGFIGDVMAPTLAGATKPQPVLHHLRILVDRINLSIRPGF